MSEVEKDKLTASRGSLPETDPDTARANRKAERRAVKGYVNGPSVELSAKVASSLDEMLIKLAAENEHANEYQVFLAVSTFLASTGYDRLDHMLVILGAILSRLELGQNPLLILADKYKSREREKGLFAQLLRDNLHLAAPAFFVSFERLKNASRPAAAMEVVQPREEIAAKVLGVAAAATQVHDPTVAEQENIPEVRPVSEIADVIAILTDFPLDSEAPIVQQFLTGQKIHMRGVAPEAARALLNVLNDPLRFDLSRIASEGPREDAAKETSPWHFLWALRVKLWNRSDLQ